MKQNAWVVVLNSKIITTVYYDKDCDSEWVKQSLIEHDGYPSNITVFKRKAIF